MKILIMNENMRTFFRKKFLELKLRDNEEIDKNRKKIKLMKIISTRGIIVWNKSDCVNFAHARSV